MLQFLYFQIVTTCYHKLLITLYKSGQAREPHRQAHHAVVVKDLLNNLGLLFLYNAQHLVEQRIGETENNLAVYGLFYVLNRLKSLGGSGTIGNYKAACTKLDTTEIAHHNNKYVGEFLAVYLPQDRLSGSARRLTVVI